MESVTYMVLCAVLFVLAWAHGWTKGHNSAWSFWEDYNKPTMRRMEDAVLDVRDNSHRISENIKDIHSRIADLEAAATQKKRKKVRK